MYFEVKNTYGILQLTKLPLSQLQNMESKVKVHGHGTADWLFRIDFWLLGNFCESQNCEAFAQFQ